MYRAYRYSYFIYTLLTISGGGGGGGHVSMA